MIRPLETGREGRKKNKKKLVPRLEKKRENIPINLRTTWEMRQNSYKWHQGGKTPRVGLPLSQEPALRHAWKPQFSGITWALKMGISVTARVN